MKYNFIKNDEQKRFELNTENQTAFTDFYFMSGKLCLTHTLVPEQLGGRGVGKKLVENILEFARENDMEIFPFCPFVSSYIKKNEQWMPIVAKGFKWR